MEVTMKIDFNSAGGRRFLLGTASLAMAVVLRCVNKLGEGNFCDLFIWVFGLTVGAVAADKLTQMMGKGKTPPVETEKAEEK
jgi:hypothetical protein